MRRIRTSVFAIVTAAGLIASSGTAHAVLTDAVLLTDVEAQAAMAYPSALTTQSIPNLAPGILMRSFKGAGPRQDSFSVLVIDPQGSGSTTDNPKAEAEKAEKQAKDTYPGLECRVYEQAGTKITIVCWGKDPAVVLAFSTDIKKYTKKKRVNGKWRNVVFKQIPVMGTVDRMLETISESEDEPVAAVVTEADRVKAANEAKALRNAQMAKLPATYQ